MKKSKWTPAQIDLLSELAKSGNVRMHAFEEVARKTNRKANSVRNYYYKNLSVEKKSFKSFSQADIKQLLREIILGTSRGESVRSICLHLANGDKGKMLRFQNKYRAILRSSPQHIEKIKIELEAQGYLVKLPYQPSFFDNVVTLPERNDKRITDSDINNLFMGLMRLIKRQAEDGARTQIEILKAEIERLKTSEKAKYN